MSALRVSALVLRASNSVFSPSLRSRFSSCDFCRMAFILANASPRSSVNCLIFCHIVALLSSLKNGCQPHNEAGGRKATTLAGSQKRQIPQFSPSQDDYGTGPCTLQNWGERIPG